MLNRTVIGPLNGSAANEDAVELVSVKGQHTNGRISRQADNEADGEVWEAGDSASDDGHVMARHCSRLHPVASAASRALPLADWDVIAGGSTALFRCRKMSYWTPTAFRILMTRDF